MSIQSRIRDLLGVLDRAFTLVHRGRRRSVAGKRYGEAIVQAGVVSGWTFFTTLASLRLVLYSKPIECLVAALINSGIMFFTVLMIKMGLLSVAEEAEHISRGA